MNNFDFLKDPKRRQKKEKFIQEQLYIEADDAFIEPLKKIDDEEKKESEIIIIELI